MRQRMNRSIRVRGMFNSTMVVFALVICGILLASLGFYRYYYTAVQTSLRSKAETASEFYTDYISRTYAEYYQSACRYAESFEDKDQIELQFVSNSGRVTMSSYGIVAGERPGTADVDQALETGRISTFVGKSAAGERIIAVSCPLFTAGGSIFGLMRFVTSTRLIDRQIAAVCALCAGIGLAIMVTVLLSNRYFLNSITEPLRSLTAVARKIAEGSYGTQAEKKYDDEIGALTDTINEMSVKIGQSEKMQAEFISSVSHELRTPLTAIMGWSETLLYDDSITGDSRRGLTIISGEVNRLAKMVEELLDFSRIQEGRFNLNVEPTDVAGELEEALSTYSELMKKEALVLHYTAPEGPIPQISADPQRLRQVFLNILDNAAKYGRSGGRIDVALHCDGETIEIITRDYGPGIPEEELGNVKKKFYKVNTKERGSGIGLAVCEEIIARLSGTLDVGNAEGGGALVTVRLPVRGV